MEAIQRYVMERLKEASTWRGIVLVLTAAGMGLSPMQAEAIIQGGIAIAGTIGILFPDLK